MVILYKNADKTVNTIADRNALVTKIDNMVVTVKDAIADPDAGAGVATYRWNEELQVWILVSKSTTETIKFITEELGINTGMVTPSNIPTDNIIWDIHVVDGNVVIATLKLEDLVINNTSISGLNDFNGYKLRFTYAYGTITQQIESYVDNAIANIDIPEVDLSAIENKLETIEEGAEVNVPETVTTLTLTGNTLNYRDENGVTNTIDMSSFKDEDLRAISSGTLSNGIVTFTRDDNTTFTLDLRDLIDVAPVTSVNGQTGDITLSIPNGSDYVRKTGSTMTGTLNIQNIEPTLYLKSTDNTAYPEAKVLHSDAGFYIQTDNSSGVLKNQYRIKPQVSGAEHVWYSDGVTKMTLNDNGELDLLGDLDISGNIKMDAGRTVDGRDISVDGTKLDELYNNQCGTILDFEGAL